MSVVLMDAASRNSRIHLPESMFVTDTPPVRRLTMAVRNRTPWAFPFHGLGGAFHARTCHQELRIKPADSTSRGTNKLRTPRPLLARLKPLRFDSRGSLNPRIQHLDSRLLRIRNFVQDFLSSPLA